MNKQYPVPQANTPGGSGGSGTVTSVGETVNGGASSGIFTVTGSPVNTTGTLNIATAGTSGGVPYFSSGTVVSSSGQLAANGVVIGGGAGTTPATNTQLTFSAPTLTVGLAGTSSGILALTGSTSGSATFTAPATAGTSTNPVTMSNILQGPNGSATVPAYSFTGLTTGGMFNNSGTVVVQSANGNGSISLGSGNINMLDGNAGGAALISGAFNATSRALQISGATDFTTTNNGQIVKVSNTTEQITLNTGGTTTDSTNNLLPAGALLLGVVARVTTTITTATNWALGDATTAARFAAANSTLTSGTTSVGLQHWQGSVSTDAAGPVQAAAAKLRITTSGTPGAGVIRVTVYYMSFTPPTS